MKTTLNHLLLALKWVTFSLVFALQFNSLAQSQGHPILAIGSIEFSPYMSQFLDEEAKKLKLKLTHVNLQKTFDLDTLAGELAIKVNSASRGDASSKPIILAHGYSGIVSLEYLKRNPNSIAGLILVGVPLDYTESSTLSTQLKRQKSLLRSSQFSKVPHYLSPEELKDPEVKSAIAPIINQNQHGIRYQFVNRHFKFNSYKRHLAEASVPILVIFGEKDLQVPVALQNQYGSLNSKVKIKSIKDSGHFPFLLEEARKDFVKTVNEFELRAQ